MAPRIARKQVSRGGRIRRNDQRGLKTYLKKLIGGGRVLSESTEAGPSSSWICTSTSWTDVKMYRNPSEICTAEFASWTILDEDFGNDEFLGECMRLYRSWTWTWRWFCEMEEETDSSEMATPLTTPSLSSIEEICCPCCCDCEGLYSYLQEEQLEESMNLFAEWTSSEEEEAAVEPVNQLVVALPSTMTRMPSPTGAEFGRFFSCQDLIVSMAWSIVLFETRHLQYINERLSLPPPPKMLALEAPREMDPPNSVSSTVSLPSGWDAVSARLSTSSVFNLFSDRVPSPIPSLFSIDPAGVPSTASTVSVPPSFWDTSSTVSVTGSAPTSTVPSSTSRVLIDPSEVSSSISTLFLDPSSAHSCSSIYSSGCSSSSLHTESLSSSSSLSSDSCDCIHCQPDSSDHSTHSDDESTDDESAHSHHTYVVSNVSSTSDCETDSDYEPVTTAVSTQTEETIQGSTARMLAECDDMLEKLVEMKKKLREML